MEALQSDSIHIYCLISAFFKDAKSNSRETGCSCSEASVTADACGRAVRPRAALRGSGSGGWLRASGGQAGQRDAYHITLPAHACRDGD